MHVVVYRKKRHLLFVVNVDINKTLCGIPIPIVGRKRKVKTIYPVCVECKEKGEQ